MKGVCADSRHCQHFIINTRCNIICNSLYIILGRFRRNIPIALTLMVRLPENFILVSPIMAPRPQNYLPFKSLYIYMHVSQFCGYAAGRNVQPIAIKFGTKFSLDVNKNWLDFGVFSPKGVEMVGGWNLKKIITKLMNDTSLVANG